MAKNTVVFRFSEQLIRDIEQTLESAPPLLREKITKKALNEAAEVFTYKVKNNIRGLKAKGRDRWGKQTAIDLQDAIRTKAARNTKYTFGKVVDIHADRKIFAEVKQYAVSVEYGHKMVIYGEPKEGRKVPEHRYWRPAKTSASRPIHNLMKRAVKRAMKEVMFGKR
jgi:hypothetical protein